MRVDDCCTRKVITATADTSIEDAARLMREHRVGTLVVVNEAGARRPIGILTDRDLVVKVMAAGLSPRALVLRDVMNPELTTAAPDDDLMATLQRMLMRGIRRIPVTDRNNALIGILSVDDILQALIEAGSAAVRLMQVAARENAGRMAEAGLEHPDLRLELDVN